MAIAGDAGLVMDERVAGTRERVEQCGFSDVGAANEGD
ncbi:GTP-binding engA domain protein [Lysobacter capsici]|nr:GTP-binding engA domain protein [Lysobacter capsici]